ncbi:MAG: transporter substrate-binding domain-containing protein [Pseudomonadales bacterium]|nr:transporter substrate-binding domain-containing protein [Pseudomonadales bacterium]
MPLKLSDEEQRWLSQHDNISLSFSDQGAPFIYKDEGGVHQGSLIDITKQLEALLGIRITSHLMPWGKAVQAAKNRQVDGVWMASEAQARNSNLLTTAVLYESRLAAYTRNPSEFTLDGFEDLNGKRIAVIRNMKLSNDIVAGLSPETSVIYSKNAGAGFDALWTGRVDVYLGLSSDNYLLMDQSRFGLKLNYIAPEMVPLSLSVRNDAPQLQSVLNKALRLIGQRQIKRIQYQWLNMADSDKTLELTDAEKNWLAKHPEIVLSVNKDIEPGLIIKPNGEFIGVNIDIIDLMNAYIDSTITLKPIQLKNQARKLNASAVQGFMGTSKKRSDQQGLLFSDKFISLSPKIYLRENSRIDINQLSDLDDLSLTYMRSDVYVRLLLKEKVNSQKIVAAADVSAAFQALLEGRADVFLGWDYDQYFINKEGISGIKQANYISDYVDIGFAIKKQDAPLLSIINKLLHIIGEQKLNAIVNRWLFMAEMPAVKKGLFSPEQKQWLKRHGTIKLGFGKYSEPMIIENQDGSYSGVVVDYFNALEKRLGINIELYVDDWFALPALLQKNQIDGFLGGNPRAVKKQGFLSSDTLAHLQLATYINTRSGFQPQNLDELNGRRIATRKIISKLTSFSLSDDSTLQIVKTSRDGLNLLMAGQVDAYVGFSYENHIIIRDQLAGLQLAFIDNRQEIAIAIAVRDDWPELVSILNIAQQDIGPQKTQAIIGKWVNIYNDKGGQSLTEKTWLASLPVLNVAFLDGFAPFSFIDSDGERIGLSQDYLNIMGEKLGLRFKFIEIDISAEDFVDVLGREADMTIQLQGKPEYRQDYAFSQAYIHSPIVVLIAREHALVSNLQALSGTEIAVLARGASFDYLQKYYPEIKLNTYTSLKEILLAVSSGREQALIANAISMDYLQRALGIDNVKTALTLDHSYQPTFLVKKEYAPLIPMINRVLDDFTEQEHKLIYDKWINYKPEKIIHWHNIIMIILAVSVFVLMALGLMGYWNRRLANEVDERRSAQLLAEQAEKKAEHASQAKSTFLANMSHEIRTPLNAILGLSEILLFEQDLKPEQLSSLKTINNAGNHLLQLINDILDISKIESGHVKIQNEPVDLQELMQQMADIFYLPCADKNIHLNFLSQANIPAAILSDEGKIRQILINLIGNAVKFTDVGGITIHLRCDVIDKKQCHLSIDVEDSGRGIAVEEYTKVFSSFEQTHSGTTLGEGTGLGLAISRQYARLMGGDIIFSSHIDEVTQRGPSPDLAASDTMASGTTFHFFMVADFAAKKMQFMDKGPIISLLENSPQITVLIVDDQFDNRLVASKILTAVGFLVIEAENGQIAVDKHRQKNVDIILMDIRMPVMDGYAAMAAIRDLPEGSTVPIIAVTASAFMEESSYIIEQGADAFLAKPYRRQRLLELIAEYTHIQYQYGLKTEPVGESAKGRQEEGVHELDKPASIETGHAVKILIADDVSVNRLVLRKMVSSEANLIEEAVNGEEALQRLLDWQPDITFLDVQMPKLNGFEVLISLRKSTDVMPVVIAVTGVDDQEQIKQLKSLGAVAVCLKPVSRDRMLALLDQFTS